MSDPTPYNPLDKINLGISVADAMLRQPVSPLPPAEPFLGAGIYAIYYTGPFEAYEAVAARNRRNRYGWPIYVGKAVPAGARKGGFGLGLKPGRDLYKRLREHAESVEEAENLDLADFRCRFLVVDDIWIPLGESLLIQRFSPVWNKVVDGYGNHDPGKGRYNQQRSPWDVVHPGREWATRCAENKRSRENILASVGEFIAESRQ